MSPLVSIITPTANRDRFLPVIARCVQRQQVSWEWLVLDDSPQPSAFMQSLAASDERVRYFHIAERMTIGAKRNALIDKARGEVIAHLDDDDYYAPDYLNFMVQPLITQQADFAKLVAFYLYAPYANFFGFTDLRAGSGHAYYATGNRKDIEFYADAHIDENWLLGYGFSYVYRKTVMDVARYEDINFREDDIFIRQAAKAGKKIVLVEDQKPCCLHIVHPASTSRCFARYQLPSFTLRRLIPDYEGYPGD